MSFFLTRQRPYGLLQPQLDGPDQLVDLELLEGDAAILRHPEIDRSISVLRREFAGKALLKIRSIYSSTLIIDDEIDPKHETMGSKLVLRGALMIGKKWS